MVTQVKAPAKEFRVCIVKEKFYARVNTVAEREYMATTKFHAFECKATSDDPDLQRFSDVTASMGVAPKPGNLVLVRDGDRFRLERFPITSGAEFVATAVSMVQPL